MRKTGCLRASSVFNELPDVIKSEMSHVFIRLCRLCLKQMAAKMCIRTLIKTAKQNNYCSGRILMPTHSKIIYYTVSNTYYGKCNF